MSSARTFSAARGHFGDPLLDALKQNALVDLKRAARAAHGYIEARLKAQATARFGDAEVTPKGEGPAGALYFVSAHVDSQNGFGAMLRTTYKCGVIVKETARVLGCSINPTETP